MDASYRSLWRARKAAGVQIKPVVVPGRGCRAGISSKWYGYFRDGEVALGKNLAQGIGRLLKVGCFRHFGEVRNQLGGRKLAWRMKRRREKLRLFRRVT